MSNKIVVRLVLLFLGVLLVAGCAGVQKEGRYSRISPKKFSPSKLPKFDIPVVMNDRVAAWIDYFQGPGRRHFERYLARSGRYIPTMQGILREYGLPQDLVYLAMIESGFSYKAYSRAAAVGHWQFIKATGSRYGLSRNNWVDERRDFVDSTHAAARYLKDLYGIFGDWYLAMAAYNAGEGKILKAVRRNDTRDFWQLIGRDRRFLKAETKDYVPKFLAAAIISKSPERFGFDNIVYDQEMEYETAKIDAQTDLAVIAKCAGADPQTIEDLNPELLKGATPPGTRDYDVRLPKGTASQFQIAYSKIPDSEKIMVVRHTVRKGESIGRIARNYGVSVREILAANDMASGRSLKKGMTIVIPKGGEAKRVIDTAVALDTRHPTGKVVKHRIQKGETLGLIAQNYGVGVGDLKRWNKLSKGVIRAGHYLKIYGVAEEPVVVAEKRSRTIDKTAAYKVRRGDSWWRVAQKQGVSIKELKEWNPELAAEDLKVGQRINLAVLERPKKLEPIETIGSPEPAGSKMISEESKSVANTSSSDMLSPPSQQQVASNPVVAVNAAPEAKNLNYRIKSGDTLWDIAKKYGVSVAKIKEWNKLEGKSHKSLKPGEQITLKLD